MKTVKEVERTDQRKVIFNNLQAGVSKLRNFTCSNTLVCYGEKSCWVQSLKTQPTRCKDVENLMGPSQKKSWQMATLLGHPTRGVCSIDVHQAGIP